MKTDSRLIIGDARKMDETPDKSVDLIVTSPPYPMIEMWDELFISLNKKIKKKRDDNLANDCFEFMHKELDKVWDECHRVLKENRFACINIGDATRTLGGDFCLYPNHSRILQYLLKIGFSVLPAILWRKQTNAPNKFMGSGMLPAGAYVTLEHEYILIVRKGGKRKFITREDKENRHESAVFWEERNNLFSDVWMDIKGTRQSLGEKEDRKRSAAYPFEIPYRLINMYSVKGDTVLDPFWGTGTTTQAAITACRNSIGYELSSGFSGQIKTILNEIVPFSNACIHERIENHIQFVKERLKMKGPLKYVNRNYGFPVITNQEKALLLNSVKMVQEVSQNQIQATYSNVPQKDFLLNWEEMIKDYKVIEKKPKRKSHKEPQLKKSVQLKLFKSF